MLSNVSEQSRMALSLAFATARQRRTSGTNRCSWILQTTSPKDGMLFRWDLVSPQSNGVIRYPYNDEIGNLLLHHPKSNLSNQQDER